MASQKYDDAISSYQLLLKSSPDKQRYQVGLSMALLGKKDYPSALGILNLAINQRPAGPAYYARGLAYFYTGNRAASVHDVQMALRSDPNNPIYRKLQNMLEEPMIKLADKNAATPMVRP